MSEHEEAYGKLRMILHRLGIYRARVNHTDSFEEFHFMRMGEFDYVDKWKERGLEQEQHGENDQRLRSRS